MANAPKLTFEVLPEAEDDAREFDKEEQALWADAKDRLRGNPEPTFIITDQRITAGPPVSFHIRFGETRAIFVAYKYVAKTKALTVIGVESYPLHDEKSMPYPRREDFVSP